MSDGKLTDLAPSPSLQRRDSFGRLRLIAWNSELSAKKASAARWLAAVDGSECSLRAVGAIARLIGIGQGDAVDLVNVQPWMSKEAAETELGRNAWAATAQARSLISVAEIPCSTYAVMGEDAASIVNLAGELGSLAICIGSHGLTAAESVLLGSVTCKVLHLTKAPVLIVR